MSTQWTDWAAPRLLSGMGLFLAAGVAVVAGAATPSWASTTAAAPTGIAPVTAPVTGSAAAPVTASATVVRYDVVANRGSGAPASAISYWTPDRLRRAQLVDQAKPAESQRTGRASLAAAATGIAPAPALTATPAYQLPPSHGSLNVGVSSTVGRVFFNDNAGGLYSCSASSVSSEGQDLLYTAAHCVFGGAGLVNDGSVPRAMYQNWVYIPGFYGFGPYTYAPYGVWTASVLATFSPWVESASLPYDLAAVTVAPHGSQTLVGLLGANAITWDPPSVQEVHAYGYPAVAPFDGNALRSCVANSGRYGGTGPYLDIVCDMNQGSSGGPWLVNTDASGVGYLTGVNSWVAFGLMFSPYFTTSALDLYNAMRFA